AEVDIVQDDQGAEALVHPERGEDRRTFGRAHRRTAQTLYGFSFAPIGTRWSLACSTMMLSSLNLLPFFAFTHWLPMRGVVTAFGTGRPAGSLGFFVQSRWPTAVLALSVRMVLTIAFLLFGFAVALRAAMATSSSATVAPSCWFHCRPVVFS